MLLTMKTGGRGPDWDRKTISVIVRQVIVGCFVVDLVVMDKESDNVRSFTLHGAKVLTSAESRSWLDPGGSSRPMLHSPA